ncbi:MAG: SpoIID/LytB domain-containing protein [Candidatus Saccharibacteria bacterium]
MKSKSIYLAGGAAVVLILALLIRMPQVKQPAKKPALPSKVTKSAEMTKYKTEPTISLYLHKTNTTQRMPIEQYLQGVVAGEVGPNPPMDALKAQAITARSLVMNRIEYENGVRAIHNTDVCDLPEHFEAYDASAITPRITEAVKATRGQVLMYNGRFAFGIFHSYAGPRTAAIEEYFPKLKNMVSAYIKSVPSAGAKYVPAQYKNWSVSIPKTDLQPIFGTMNLDDIKITKKGPSGRIIDITAGGKTVKGWDMRAALGSQRLKSTLITKILPQDESIVFQGQGWGHGVGLSQWGAFEMAKGGKSTAQILQHYFPSTKVVKLWK